MERFPIFVFVKYTVFILLVLLAACSGTERPLDAKERQRIDSISTAQIQVLRRQIDSSCLAAQTNELPRLVDSLLAERRREIQQMLKDLPR